MYRVRALYFILFVLFAYVVISTYGASKEFETALNASETVTPLMLATMFDVLHSYILLFVLILILTRR